MDLLKPKCSPREQTKAGTGRTEQAIEKPDCI